MPKMNAVLGQKPAVFFGRNGQMAMHALFSREYDES